MSKIVHATITNIRGKNVLGKPVVLDAHGRCQVVHRRQRKPGYIIGKVASLPNNGLTFLVCAGTVELHEQAKTV